MAKNILNEEQQKHYDFMLKMKEKIKYWWFTKGLSYILISIELDNIFELEYIEWELVSYFIEIELY